MTYEGAEGAQPWEGSGVGRVRGLVAVAAASRPPRVRDVKLHFYFTFYFTVKMKNPWQLLHVKQNEKYVKVRENT